MKYFGLFLVSVFAFESVYSQFFGLAGLFRPAGFNGFGLRRFEQGPNGPRLARLRGGRDTETVEQLVTNTTLCAYSSMDKEFACAGAVHNFQCNVTERLTGLEKLEIRLADFEMVPVEEKSVEVVRILSRASSGLFTMIKPKTRDEIVLSFFNSDKFQGPGFWIKDEKCWTHLQQMLKDSNKDDISLALIVN